MKNSIFKMHVFCIDKLNIGDGVEFIGKKINGMLIVGKSINHPDTCDYISLHNALEANNVITITMNNRRINNVRQK